MATKKSTPARKPVPAKKASSSAAAAPAAKKAKTVPVKLTDAKGKSTTIQTPPAIASKLNKAIDKAAKKKALTKSERTAAEIRGGAVDLAIDIRKAARELPVSPATKKAINESAKAMDRVVESIDSDMAAPLKKVVRTLESAIEATKPRSMPAAKATAKKSDLTQIRRLEPATGPKPVSATGAAASKALNSKTPATKPVSYAKDLANFQASGTPAKKAPAPAASAPQAASIRTDTSLQRELAQKARTAILGG